MREYKRKQHIEFLENNSNKFKNKSNLSKTDLEYLFNSIIELLYLPLPPSELRVFFYHPNIISDLLYEIYGSNYLTSGDRNKAKYAFDSLSRLMKKRVSNYNVDIRVLAPGGQYPNTELNRAGCKYTINNQTPVLKTKNRIKMDDFFDNSVVNWLTRNELRFATCITCAPEDRILYLNFTGQNRLKIDYDCIKDIPKELEIYFLKELLDIKRKFIPMGNRSWNKKPFTDVNEFEYYDFNESIAVFNQLFDNFSIQNDLLLRTCNYFAKSRMLWDNEIYSEEAINCNYFCLEGCLHLIQKKLGDAKPKLNRKLLFEFFKNDFPHGESLFDFIQEGYSIRNTLIHAEPNWGAEWSPFVISSDFYDYFKICRMLLNYILIDRFLDDY